MGTVTPRASIGVHAGAVVSVVWAVVLWWDQVNELLEGEDDKGM